METIQQIMSQIRRLNARKEGFDISPAMPDVFLEATGISADTHHLTDEQIESFARRCAAIRISESKDKHKDK